MVLPVILKKILCPDGRTLPGTAAAFTGAAMLFLPKLIRFAVKADTDAVLEAFGKNGQTRMVFRALFAALAGLVLAEIVDPETTRQIVGILTGTGV